MSDYISREATKKSVCEGCNAEYGEGPCEPSECYIMRRLASIPAADVVEVVRCKDCKHSYDDVNGLCCAFGALVDCIVPDDFFCQYGGGKTDA